MHKQANEKRDNDKKQVRTCWRVLKLPELQLSALDDRIFFFLSGCVFLITGILPYHSVAVFFKELQVASFYFIFWHSKNSQTNETLLSGVHKEPGS